MEMEAEEEEEVETVALKTPSNDVTPQQTLRRSSRNKQKKLNQLQEPLSGHSTPVLSKKKEKELGKEEKDDNKKKKKEEEEEEKDKKKKKKKKGKTPIKRKRAEKESQPQQKKKKQKKKKKEEEEEEEEEEEGKEQQESGENTITGGQSYADLEKKSSKKFLELLEESLKLGEDSEPLYDQSTLLQRSFDYLEEIGKMLFCFGATIQTNQQTLQLLEIYCDVFTQMMLETIVEETVKRYNRKTKKTTKINKNFFRQKVNLGQVVVPLSEEKKARMKDVVSFLRRNKKIERMHQGVEEGYFDDESSIFEEVDEDEQNLLVESFWNSMGVGTASDKSKQLKMERLKFRDEITQDMSQQDYLYFSECTKISFTRPQKRVKFSNWCKLTTYPIAFNKECIDVLGQLTFEFLEETIRSIVSEKEGKPPHAILPKDLHEFLKIRVHSTDSKMEETKHEEKGG